MAFTAERPPAYGQYSSPQGINSSSKECCLCRSANGRLPLFPTPTIKSGMTDVVGMLKVSGVGNNRKAWGVAGLNRATMQCFLDEFITVQAKRFQNRLMWATHRHSRLGVRQLKSARPHARAPCLGIMFQNKSMIAGSSWPGV